MPETIQTSPFQVVTAADLPSEKKSTPLRRIHEDQGLFSGTASESTTYAAAGSLGFTASSPWVSMMSFHRAGPPWVRERGSGWGGRFFAIAETSPGPMTM